MKFYLYIVLLLCLMSCHNKSNDTIAPKPILSMDFEGLESVLNQKNDTTYVVNFWATWCAPCVEELPYFEKINRINYKTPVKVILVSLDMPSQLESRLKPFVKENNISSQVILLNDINQNEWIPKINSDWDGAIPVTLIYNNKKREFYNRAFSETELQTTLKTYL